VRSARSNRTAPTTGIEGGPKNTEGYLAVRNNRASTYSIRNVHGGVVDLDDGGSFRNTDDSRSNLSLECSSVASEKTISICICCVPGHPVLGKDVKPVFVLTDQMFPAAVPLNSPGRCLSIIRIEDAHLWELATTFLARIKASWLPAGCQLAPPS